jgi:hypothetical protein
MLKTVIFIFENSLIRTNVNSQKNLKKGKKNQTGNDLPLLLEEV